MTNTIDARRALAVYSYLDNPEVLLQIPQPHRLRLSELMHGAIGDRDTVQPQSSPTLDQHREVLSDMICLIDSYDRDWWQQDHVDKWSRLYGLAQLLLADSGEIQSINLAELRDFVAPLYKLMWVEGAKQIVITREPLGDCRVAMFADVRYGDAHGSGALDVTRELLELMRRLRAENGSPDHVSACLTVFYALAFVVEDFAGQQALAAEFHEFERSSNHGS